MAYDEWKHKQGYSRYAWLRKAIIIVLIIAAIIAILTGCTVQKFATDREMVAKVVTVTRTGMGKYRMLMSDSSVVLYGSNFRPYPGQVYRVRYSSTDTGCIKKAIIQRVK